MARLAICAAAAGAAAARFGGWRGGSVGRLGGAVGSQAEWQPSYRWGGGIKFGFRCGIVNKINEMNYGPLLVHLR